MEMFSTRPACSRQPPSALRVASTRTLPEMRQRDTRWRGELRTFHAYDRL